MQKYAKICRNILISRLSVKMEHAQLTSFLKNMEQTWKLSICVKDFVGFIPIDKALYEALTPYLGHNNPYCIHVKSDKERYHHCLSMMKKIFTKSMYLNGKSFYGICYAGVGEYVFPITGNDQLLGAITVGCAAVPPDLYRPRIERAMVNASEEERRRAFELYENNIIPMTATSEQIVPAFEFVASYLAQSYHAMTSSGNSLIIAKKRTNNEEVFKHFLNFVHEHYSEDLNVKKICNELYCSESYLNHLVKKRLGVTISTYINKLRVEHAKEFLLNTDDSILNVAVKVGFSDQSYFSRVFMQLMDITPSEFRRRYK